MPQEPLRFVGPDGAVWSVHEITDQPQAGQLPVVHGVEAPRPPSALLFVSAGGFRRVREYPSNWRELSTTELWELSWKR